MIRLLTFMNEEISYFWVMIKYILIYIPWERSSQVESDFKAVLKFKLLAIESGYVSTDREGSHRFESDERAFVHDGDIEVIIDGDLGHFLGSVVGLKNGLDGAYFLGSQIESGLYKRKSTSSPALFLSLRVLMISAVMVSTIPSGFSRLMFCFLKPAVSALRNKLVLASAL